MCGVEITFHEEQGKGQDNRESQSMQIIVNYDYPILSILSNLFIDFILSRLFDNTSVNVRR